MNDQVQSGVFHQAVIDARTKKQRTRAEAVASTAERGYLKQMLEAMAHQENVATLQSMRPNHLTAAIIIALRDIFGATVIQVSQNG